jgi:hypothetical protein
MSINGFLLSTAAFQTLTPSAQSEVLASIGLDKSWAFAPAQPKSGSALAVPSASALDEGPVELTVAMVRKLTDRLSDKTLTALKVIAQSDSPHFHMKDVISATVGASNYMDIRAVWSALTRRTRNIMDDANADLIWWTGEEIYDGEGAYVDHVGSIAPLTYQSLRTHFGF